MLNFRFFRYIFAEMGSKDVEKWQTNAGKVTRNWQFGRRTETGRPVAVSRDRVTRLQGPVAKSGGVDS